MAYINDTPTALSSDGYTQNHHSTQHKQYRGNIIVDKNALNKYICKTIQQSIKSIDKALAINVHGRWSL